MITYLFPRYIKNYIHDVWLHIITRNKYCKLLNALLIAETLESFIQL